jgi:NAD-dependent DNA ligase
MIVSEPTINAIAELLLHAKHYYYRGEPFISDTVYDRLEDVIKRQEPQHSVLHIVGDPFKYGESL